MDTQFMNEKINQILTELEDLRKQDVVEFKRQLIIKLKEEFWDEINLNITDSSETSTEEDMKQRILTQWKSHKLSKHAKKQYSQDGFAICVVSGTVMEIWEYCGEKNIIELFQSRPENYTLGLMNDGRFYTPNNGNELVSFLAKQARILGTPSL